MKIGVLSDTHVSEIGQLPQSLVRRLAEVDLIVHLGDYTGKEVLDGLRRLGNFRGVRGNMDPASVRQELPETDMLEVEGKRIGLIHGWGSPTGMEEKVRSRFSDVDAILYGHTHMPANRVQDGVLLLNPGSATGRFPAVRQTYGILSVMDSIRGEVITIRRWPEGRR